MRTEKIVSKAILFTFLAGLTLLGYNLVEAQAQTPSSYQAAVNGLHPGLPQTLAEAQNAQGGQNRAPLQKNLNLIGFTDLGRPANGVLTADVWAYGNFAYVGTFIDFTGTNTGVQVVDISDPANPQLVNELPSAVAFNGANDVKVATINTQYFRGDLLVMSQEFGGLPANGGIQIWDVTDPLNAEELSQLFVGPVHNAYLYQKGSRAFVLLASPFLEVATQPGSIFFPGTTIGDVIIVEVTDPRNPVVLADWGAGKDGGFPFGFPFPIPSIGFPATCDDPSICRGASPFVNCHDLWANQEGTVAYLSYWDLGLILLDISDPANPTLIGRGIEPATFGNDEGNLHNAVQAQGGNLVVVGDEDFAPGPWGFLRTFDTLDPTNPDQIGAFATDGSLNDPTGTRTMHNIFVRGNNAYLSWYDEGIRIVDLSQPATPREIASFIPDPNQTGPGRFWGVYVHNDLVLASDLLSGLFILKQEASGLLSKTGAASPSEFALIGNYPNPFNPTTEIRFQLPEKSHVVVRILNTLGQEIRILADGQYERGYHNLRWDGKDNNGNLVASGIYLYQMQAGSFSEIGKMTLLR